MSDNKERVRQFLKRVERSRIAEHWDVIETIPPREQWANDNGKF